MDYRTFEHDASHNLLGKWRRDKANFSHSRGFFLRDHIKEVMWALDFMFNDPFLEYPSFGHALHDLMRLPCTIEEFQRWCYLSALAHDMGKAGGEFQWMLWRMEDAYREYRRDNPKANARDIQTYMAGQIRYQQAYRHEFLSAILLYAHPKIRDWFKQVAGSPEGFDYILSAVFGHHIKVDVQKALRSRRFDDADWKTTGCRPGTGLKHVFLHELGSDLSRLLKDRPFPALPVLQDWESTQPEIATADKLEKLFEDICRDSEDDNPISAAIKWVVILADTYGSIDEWVYTKDDLDKMTPERRARAMRPIRDRIQEGFLDIGEIPDVDYMGRILKRLQDNPNLSPEERLETNLRPQQKRCRTLMHLLCTFATGGGKTVASLACASRMPHRRMIFCGNTTDATTRLFFDYREKDQDALRHCRAEMDLDLHATHEDNAEEDKQEEEEALRGLDIFKGFQASITYSTVDQVLGIMAFYRSSVMWLPYLMSAQIVFDEVHGYDPVMRGWYTQFMKWFPGFRTIHLTATLPEAQREEIETALKSRNPDAKLEVVRDDPIPLTGQEIASCKAPRYRIHVLPGTGAGVAEVYFQAGTLWFTNLVRRCQDVGQRFTNALVYHSRFRGKDRNGIRDALCAAFHNVEREKFMPTLRAVATQAGQESINISAFSLITEVCPPAAFVQRLGRVNRETIPGSPADIYVYMPDMSGPARGLPYDGHGNFMESYQRWMAWIAQFDGRVISQDDLEQAFQAFYEDKSNFPPPIQTESNMKMTFRRNVRQMIVTIPCILRKDLAEIQAEWDRDPRKGHKAGRQMMELLSVPAILSPADRRDLHARNALFEKRYIIDTPYDLRLGLLKGP